MTIKHCRYGYPRFLAWGIFIFFSFGFQATQAQKVLKKTWQATSLQKLEILAENAFSIQITTYSGDQIGIEARMEGEHSEQIVLNSEIIEGVLSVRPGYQEFFVHPNDKLAAHKVISISLHITVPEKFNVFISAPKAHLEGKGTYDHLSVHLGMGNCSLKNFRGNAELYTVSGSIEVEAYADTAGEAISNKGEVINHLEAIGLYRLKAESVKGDISLRKSTE